MHVLEFKLIENKKSDVGLNLRIHVNLNNPFQKTCNNILS